MRCCRLLILASCFITSLALARSPERPKVAGPVNGKMPASSVMPWGRPADPRHPLRQQVGAEPLLRAVVGLAAGGKTNQLQRHVRRALSKLAAAPERSLAKPRVQAKLLAALRAKLGGDRYELILGQQAVGVKDALKQLERPSWDPPDPQDMQRGWGWRLLAKNDKAFRDPRFVGKLLQESDQTGPHNYSPMDEFRGAWSKIAPSNTSPVQFALTGSDANNLLYTIAHAAALRRTG